jgi:hypothetical protein
MQEGAVENKDSRRLNVWRALSNLFLDTEVDEVTFKYIARTVLESKYSPPEIYSILWGEVFPVLEGNLKSVAGIWEGWPDEWLLKNIKIIGGAPAKQGDTAIIREIKRCWSNVASYLPPEYA